MRKYISAYIGAILVGTLMVFTGLMTAQAVPNNVTSCPAGTVLVASGDGNDNMLSVTVVDDPTDNITITIVYVKGGNGFIEYTSPPWVGLVAPNNASGGPAAVSHWLACGVPDNTSSSSTTESSSTSSSESSTTSSSIESSVTTTTDVVTTTSTTASESSSVTESSSSESSSVPSSSVESSVESSVTVTESTTSTSSSPAAINAKSDSENLAYTGSNGTFWFIGIGVLAILLGATALLLTRRHNR